MGGQRAPERMAPHGGDQCAARAPTPHPNPYWSTERGHLWSTRLSTSGSTAPSRRPSCDRRRRSSPTAPSCPVGLRRLEHQPGHGRPQRLRADPGLLLPRPDPRRQGRPRDVRGLLRRRQAAPDEHPRRARQDGEEVRQARVACSASSRSTRSSRTAARTASRSAASRPRRAATTAASAPTRSSAARSSRSTSTTASPPACRSAASTPR